MSNFSLKAIKRVSNGKPSSKPELTMKWWKATFKQFFEEDTKLWRPTRFSSEWVH